MTSENTKSRFSARLLRPQNPAGNGSWSFVVVPQQASAKLPRRGRTTVTGTLNGQAFQALLEPDGQKSHWLKIDEKLLGDSGVSFPDALATWKSASTIARLDWMHWITSARQTKTRVKRIRDACDMLASGKKTVCCFDSSGVYSKAFRPPKAAV